MDTRAERPADQHAIARIHTEAFGREGEAVLVDRLRLEGAARVSLVAQVAEQIVGHVLFSEAQLEIGSRVLGVGALGPVAVLERHRRLGLAAALIRTGLDRGWQLGWPAVIVVGDPAYYTRFGFARADAWSIRCALDVPPEAFMIAFAGSPIQGPAIARYHPAFGEV